MEVHPHMILPLKIARYITGNSLFTIAGLQEHRYRSGMNTHDDLSRPEDIDTGLSGLILFLIELTKIKPEPDLRCTLLSAGDELINYCRCNQRSHFGLYKGRAGVCFTLMRLTETTGDPKYMEFALELIENESEVFLRSEFAANRLYDGRSGLLLALVHLYNYVHNQMLLEKIEICLNIIVSDFVITENGIIWNRNDRNIKPLNSFLFGSAGVAFSLMQAADLFNDKVLLAIAESIFSYEDTFWCNEFSNWPDFRNEINDENDLYIQKSKYLSNDFNYFTQSSESYDLSTGTAGLCLARLPLLNKMNHNGCKDKISKGLQRIMRFRSGDSSLANGLSGVGTVFQEATGYFGTHMFDKKLNKISEVLNHRRLNYKDITLFNGATGLGYFLIQRSNPETFSSILFPVLKKNEPQNKTDKNESISNGYLIKMIQSNFPLTLTAIKIFNPEAYSELLQKELNITGYISNDIYSLMISKIKKLIPLKAKHIISDILKLESVKCRMYNEVNSFSLNHIKNILKFECKVKLLNMEEHELMNQVLVFDSDTRIHKCKWNWARLGQEGADIKGLLTKFQTEEPQKIKLILMMDSKNIVVEQRIDTLGTLTRKIFRKPKKVQEALADYLKAFEIESDQDREEIIRYVKTDIIYYIRKTLLTCPQIMPAWQKTENVNC